MTDPKSSAKISDIARDQFVKKLFGELPSGLSDSFSDEQLEGLKSALDREEWEHHTVDIRRAFGFFRWRYYFVLLIGSNQRQSERDSEKTPNSLELAFIVFFLLFSILTGLVVIYIAKAALGIDLIPSSEIGIWEWFGKS